jgi:hypothetical protein
VLKSIYEKILYWWYSAMLNPRNYDEDGAFGCYYLHKDNSVTLYPYTVWQYNLMPNPNVGFLGGPYSWSRDKTDILLRQTFESSHLRVNPLTYTYINSITPPCILTNDVALYARYKVQGPLRIFPYAKSKCHVSYVDLSHLIEEHKNG